MSEHIEQIKNRIAPSSLIGRYVTLKSKPNGEYSGLCPFHSEKTPSFTVNDHKGFFHCFGCQEHGDIFSFIMKIENISYKEALIQLAREAGIALPSYTANQQNIDDLNKLTYKIYEIAATYYENCLTNNEGRQALLYCQKRGLSSKIIKQFRLGFAPNNINELIALYAKQKITEQQLVEAQIIRKGEHGYYNIFRNRLIFPIQDKQGRVIAFGGRILGSGEPKYLNSPENPIFIKGQHLYGLHHAAKPCAQAKEMLIVEGYMDVLSLAEKGVSHVVAPLGTSLKTSQIEMLWRLTPEPTICLDADASGKRASNRIAQEIIPFLKPGYSIKLCELTGGKDPDEIITTQGLLFWQKLIKNSLSLAQYIFVQYCNEYDLSTPEGQAACANHFKSICKKINDPELQKNYFVFFQQALRDHLWQTRKKNYPSSAKKNFQDSGLQHIKQHLLPGNAINANTVNILAIIFCFKKLLRKTDVIERLSELEIECKTLDKIRNYLLSIKDYEIEEENALEKQILRTKFEEQLGSNAGLESASNCAFFELQSITDEQMAATHLERAFKISTLETLRGQIASAQKLLRDYPENESLFTRMAALKNHEESLKLELGII
jgi:DNA primase